MTEITRKTVPICEICHRFIELGDCDKLEIDDIEPLRNLIAQIGPLRHLTGATAMASCTLCATQDDCHTYRVS